MKQGKKGFNAKQVLKYVAPCLLLASGPSAWGCPLWQCIVQGDNKPECHTINSSSGMCLFVNNITLTRTNQFFYGRESTYAMFGGCKGQGDVKYVCSFQKGPGISRASTGAGRAIIIYNALLCSDDKKYDSGLAALSLQLVRRDLNSTSASYQLGAKENIEYSRLSAEQRSHLASYLGLLREARRKINTVSGDKVSERTGIIS